MIDIRPVSLRAAFDWRVRSATFLIRIAWFVRPTAFPRFAGVGFGAGRCGRIVARSLIEDKDGQQQFRTKRLGILLL